MIKYTITNYIVKYAIANDVIKYAMTNDVIKYAITNYVINKKINNDFVFSNTPPQLLLEVSCLFSPDPHPFQVLVSFALGTFTETLYL